MAVPRLSTSAIGRKIRLEGERDSQYEVLLGRLTGFSVNAVEVTLNIEVFGMDLVITLNNEDDDVQVTVEGD